MKAKKITWSTGFLLVAAILIYLDGQGIVLWCMFACILHELGHWGVIVLLGGGVRALRLTAVGAEMELDPYHPLSYGREALAALAGPTVNLLLAWACTYFDWYLFAGMNLCFGLFNLLPIYPLDGGRALSGLLNTLWPQKADSVIRVISAAFSGAFLGLGWFSWQRWGNLTLLFAAVWLLAKTLK